ncbi:MAG: hypothetical protein ACE37F_12195 [Nannocystaceae bacterium]|nr:hypothetical protein [bacterium]
MHTRPWNWAAALLLPGLLGGCASGEIDDDAAPGSAVREAPVQGDLFIEVTDSRGAPLQPDSVVLTIDGERTVEADCMHGEDGRCQVWVGGFAAMQRVTAWASSCGHRFGAAVPLGPEVDESEPYEGAVTIVGVAGLCTGGTPIP